MLTRRHVLLGTLTLALACGDDPAPSASENDVAAAAVAAVQGAAEAVSPTAESDASEMVVTISGGTLGEAPVSFTVPLRDATMTRSLFSLSTIGNEVTGSDGRAKLLRFTFVSNVIDEGRYEVTEDRGDFRAQFDVDATGAGDDARSVRPVSGVFVIERRSGGVLSGRFEGEGRSTQGNTGGDVYRIEARFRAGYSTSMVPD